jgi:hypothetical protein
VPSKSTPVYAGQLSQITSVIASSVACLECQENPLKYSVPSSSRVSARYSSRKATSLTVVPRRLMLTDRCTTATDAASNAMGGFLSGARTLFDHNHMSRPLLKDNTQLKTPTDTSTQVHIYPSIADEIVLKQVVFTYIYLEYSRSWIGRPVIIDDGGMNQIQMWYLYRVVCLGYWLPCTDSMILAQTANFAIQKQYTSRSTACIRSVNFWLIWSVFHTKIHTSATPIFYRM